MPDDDPYGGLSGEERNVAVAVRSILASYGLESLADRIVGYIQEGYSADTMMLLLEKTDEWKARFAGNEIRRARGFNVLSPAEYIAVENASRELYSSYGFPPGFYDQPADFAKQIGNGVSPAILQRRLQARAAVFDAQHTQATDYFQRQYGTTREGSFAYFIDPDRALPLLEKMSQAALIGGAARAAGFGQDDLSLTIAERLSERGVSEAQALSGFGQLAGLRGLMFQLAGQAGPTVTEEDLVQAGFEQNIDAAQRVEAAKATRTADFGEGGGGFATTREGAVGLRIAGQ